MLGFGCAVLSCLLTLTLFHCSVDSLHLTQESPEYGALEEPVSRGRPVEPKSPEGITAKLLLLDQQVALENDVIETKKKRSFPGSNTPMDRLSISTMDNNKNNNNKQRKVVELPRRRVNVPIDRIGVGRLPSNRG
ncbi:osteocrin [Alosa sapidissima]|uniref:osteocrin n=1 Tax=Alosa sapidissima TaxID=34773 RepID=UPI001C088963|nr:osteocrin [Alosa sapidissima]